MPKALHDQDAAEVGIRELRANLSRWIARVREGQGVVVTDRGRPVARVVPYDAATDDPFGELIAQGLVRPPQRPKAPSLPPPIPTEGIVTDLLLQERRENW